MRKILCGICWAVFAAGAVLTVAGLYLLVVEAGIPYQEPTPEMTAHWMAANQAGERILALGVPLLAAGGAGFLLFRRRR